MNGFAEALRRTVAGWPRRLLVFGTVLLGVLTAVLVAATGAAAERTLPNLLTLTQSGMSVLTPLIGIVLVGDLRDTRRGVRAAVLPTLLAGLGVAAVIGLVGTVVCVALTSQRDGVGAPAVGSALVQGVALLTGTGLGMLICSRLVAFLATIVIPLGLWRLFGTVERLEPARGWLTQLESARRLLGDEMTPLSWVQFLVMFSIWGVALNLAGAWRLRAGRR